MIQSLEDQLWLLASATQVSELSEKTDESNQCKAYLKSFTQQSENNEQDFRALSPRKVKYSYVGY